MKKISLMLICGVVLFGLCGCSKSNYDENFDYKNYVLGTWDFLIENNETRTLTIKENNICEQTDVEYCEYLVYKNYLVVKNIEQATNTNEYIKGALDGTSLYDTEIGTFNAYIIDNKNDKLRYYELVLRDKNINGEYALYEKTKN